MTKKRISILEIDADKVKNNEIINTKGYKYYLLKTGKNYSFSKIDIGIHEINKENNYIEYEFDFDKKIYIRNK